MYEYTLFFKEVTMNDYSLKLKTFQINNLNFVKNKFEEVEYILIINFSDLESGFIHPVSESPLSSLLYVCTSFLILSGLLNVILVVRYVELN